jgi:hypothetical protein
MTAPAPLGPSIINNHIAKRAPSRHDGALRTAMTMETAAQTQKQGHTWHSGSSIGCNRGSTFVLRTPLPCHWELILCLALYARQMSLFCHVRRSYHGCDGDTCRAQTSRNLEVERSTWAASRDNHRSLSVTVRYRRQPRRQAVRNGDGQFPVAE